MVEGPDGDDVDRGPPRRACSRSTWDHRAFDGAYAASFLHAMRERARDARLGRRARREPTLGVRSGRGGSGRSPYARRRRAPARRCTSARDDDYLLLLEHPHVYTLGTQRRSRARARRRRRRSVPSSCTPTAAATSRTTGPASSSATRSSRCPSGATACATSSRTSARSRRVLIAALADFGIDGDACSRGYTGVWVGDEKIARDRRARSRAAAPATASRSTSIPTSRCSTTSCRAASATGASRRWPGCSARRAADARGRRRGRRRASPTHFGYDDRRAPGRRGSRHAERRSATSSVPTSRGGMAGDGSRCGCSGGSPPPGVDVPASDPAVAPARVDAGARPTSATGYRATQAARCATSTCTPSARRPAARTSTSAGPTAPPRS